MGITNTNTVIKWWDPKTPNDIKYCTSAKFNEYITYLPDGKLSPGTLFMQGKQIKTNYTNTYTIDFQKHPILSNSPIQVNIKLPPKGCSLGINCYFCDYHAMPYIKTVIRNNQIWRYLPTNIKNNFWILAVGNNTPITVKQMLQDIKSHQKYNKAMVVKLLIAKQNDKVKSTFQAIRASFHQI